MRRSTTRSAVARQQAFVEVAVEAAKAVSKRVADQASKHPDIAKQAGSAAVAASTWAAKKGPGSLAAVNAHRAERHAWTLTGGQFSTGIVLHGRSRAIVWKDGAAIACYPPLSPGDLNGTPLGTLPELTGVKPELRKDPRPPFRERHRRR